jgi:hypothetical protein
MQIGNTYLIKIFSVGVICMKRNQINFLMLALYLILVSIAFSGCLLQNKPGHNLTSALVTTTAEITPIPLPVVPTPLPTSAIPSEQSGVRMFKNTESICIGQTLTFGLINEGNSTMEFAAEDPYLIQIDNNGTWGNIFYGGGFQGFWRLYPEDKIERNAGFATGNGLYEYYNESSSDEFTVRPGLYRIVFGGENEETKEPFTVATEFNITECQAGIPV